MFSKTIFGDEGLFPEKSANFDWSGDDCHNLGNLWLTTMRLVLSWQLIARKDVSKRSFFEIKSEIRWKEVASFFSFY